MKFLTKPDTDTAAAALIEELLADGFVAAVPESAISTNQFRKAKNGINHVVKMNITEKKIDVFHGAFLSTGEKVQHKTWRIKSDTKKNEVSWKIRSF